MFKKVPFIAVLLLVLGAGVAHAIPVGTFGEIDEWAIASHRLSGYGGSYAGVDPVAALIGDDLSDGAINITRDDSFKLGFRGIINNPGNDFAVFEARFVGVPATVDVTVGTTKISIMGYGSNKKFTDSGLDYVLKNSADELGYDLNFDLFGAPLDLDAWGVPAGATVKEIIITGTSANPDILGVGVLHAAPVPEPASLLLLGSALFTSVVIKKKS